MGKTDLLFVSFFFASLDNDDRWILGLLPSPFSLLLNNLSPLPPPSPHSIAPSHSRIRSPTHSFIHSVTRTLTAHVHPANGGTAAGDAPASAEEFFGFLQQYHQMGGSLDPEQAPPELAPVLKALSEGAGGAEGLAAMLSGGGGGADGGGGGGGGGVGGMGGVPGGGVYS